MIETSTFCNRGKRSDATACRPGDHVAAGVFAGAAGGESNDHVAKCVGRDRRIVITLRHAADRAVATGVRRFVDLVPTNRRTSAGIDRLNGPQDISCLKNAAVETSVIRFNRRCRTKLTRVGRIGNGPNAKRRDVPKRGQAGPARIQNVRPFDSRGR